MKRTKHDIDTQLVNFFIVGRSFDNNINEALLDWHSSLGNQDHQKTRDEAIRFLSILSFDVLSEIDYPVAERKNLIAIFEPLEQLLRTAISLKDFGDSKPEKVRDHLSHTVRNVLFVNYILFQYKSGNNSNLRRQLIIASIFHDIAYPIEKLKKVARNLGDATFKQLLNSAGKIEIELDNPDDLLEILDFFGRLVDKYRLKRKNLASKIERLNKKETINTVVRKNEKELKSLELSLAKIEFIYTEIISTAIAGKGLFESSHFLSSVVLFLRPIIKHWKDSDPYQELNFDSISDICLAMAYHDRENDINKIPFEKPLILGIMRISDELQEWDREENSFIKDVILHSRPSTILSVEIIMKDRNEDDICKPELVIPHKIKGILPVINDEYIHVDIVLPEEFSETETLKKCIEEEHIDKKKYKVSGKERSSKIALKFKNSKVTITLN